MRRNQRLFVPVNSDEKNMAVSLSEDSGLPIAAVIRQMIRQAYRQVRKTKEHPVSAQ